MKSCIQCGKPADENYCSFCGQNQNIQRLTLKSFFNDFFSRVYGLDGAFPRTVLGLAINPARVAKEYIEGIRGKYVGPVGYYFLIFAIFLLVVQFSDYTLDDYLPKTEEYADSLMENNNPDRVLQVKELAFRVKQKVFNSIQYVAVLIVPLFAMWCGIWFRKSKYNFIENAVFAFFIHAQAIIINILGFVFFANTGLKSNTVITALSVIYYVWSISHFYVGKIQFKAIIKGVLAHVFAYLCFLILVMFVVLIGLLLTGGFEFTA
ncbi:MAG: DUF3667 domain-containing protein [Reichenbachiella sp.]|uniref:DUF3667 domain-containing protein n=1 Tax=Reichenbachiella sp. TaxID=2184521 RepID=UPI0032666033